MDTELKSILMSASQEAENRLGESFIASDSQTYTGVFQAPDAFQLAALGLEMQMHGYPDRTAISLICTRQQFTRPPWSWRGQKITRTNIDPPQTLIVASMTADDPLHFGFVLTNFQPAR